MRTLFNHLAIVALLGLGLTGTAEGCRFLGFGHPSRAQLRRHRYLFDGRRVAGKASQSLVDKNKSR